MKWRAGLLLLLGLPCLHAASAADRRYVELSTAQLTLISAASEEETRKIALHVEMFRTAVELALRISTPKAIQTRIYALSDRDWKKYAEPRRGVSGYFLSHPASSDLMFNADDASARAYELIFHEYLHHILRTSWPGEVPPFFDEGLAEVFSTVRFDEGTVRLEPRPDYVRFLRRRDWLPFERLLNVKRHDPEYVEHNLAPAFYAQAWATMYYAIAIDPATGSRLMEYLRDLQEGSPSLHAAEHFVGASASDANRKIAAFIRRRERLPIAQLQVAQWEGADSTLRRLNHSESTTAIGELVLRFGTRHEKAQELFEAVLRSDPHNVRALVGKAWSHLQASDWQRAAALLDEAAAADPADPPTAVALGRGLYQLVAATVKTDPPISEQRERLLRSRTLFESALVNSRTRIEAIRGYVLASLALGESGEALIVLAEIGFRVAPRSSDLAVALAILHDSAGRKDVARAYWKDAARNTQTGPLRARIMDALKATDNDSQQLTH